VSDRLASIQAASRGHPIVLFALDQLDDDEDTFAPRDSLGPALVERLGALDADALLAAVLGLFDLATVLQEKSDAFEAAEVILGALEKMSSRIESASEGLPGLAGALKRDRKKDGFGGSARASTEPHAGSHLGNAGFDLTASPKKKR